MGGVPFSKDSLVTRMGPGAAALMRVEWVLAGKSLATSSSTLTTSTLGMVGVSYPHWMREGGGGGGERGRGRGS